MNDDLKEGWAKPINSKRFHYFGADRRALCGGWMFFGELEPDDGEPGPLDCRACARKMAGRQALKEQGETP